MTGLRGVLAALFPPPPERLDDEPPRSRPIVHSQWAVAAAIVAALAAGTAASLLRQAGAPAIDTLWAEDGGVFLQGAYKRSPVDALTLPYAEYVHLVPRLVAEFAALVPPASAAAVVTTAAALIAAGCGVLVWFATAWHLRSRVWRAVLAALVVLQPAAGLESLNSIALAQWQMLFAAFWLLLWRPVAAATAWAATAALMLIGLSAPLVVVLAPLAVLRLVATWRPGLAAERAPAVALLGTAAVQVGVFLATASAPGEITIEGLGRALTLWVVGVAALGVEGTQSAWLALGPVLVPLLAVAAAVLLGIGLWRADPVRRWTALAAVVSAAVLFVVPVVLRAGDEMAWQVGAVADVGSRYAVTPVLLLTSAAALLVDARRHSGAGADRHARGAEPDHDSRRAVSVWRAGLTWALVAGIAVATIADLVPVNRRSEGPRWRPAVAEAAEACEAAPDASTQRVAIPPAAAGWALNVPCHRLR